MPASTFYVATNMTGTGTGVVGKATTPFVKNRFPAFIATSASSPVPTTGQLWPRGAGR